MERGGRYITQVCIRVARMNKLISVRRCIEKKCW